MLKLVVNLRVFYYMRKKQESEVDVLEQAAEQLARLFVAYVDEFNNHSISKSYEPKQYQGAQRRGHEICVN